MAAAVSLSFYRSDDGSDSDYDVLDKKGSLHIIRQPSPAPDDEQEQSYSDAGSGQPVQLEIPATEQRVAGG